MLLYTLAGEETAGRIARRTGIADELGYAPVRVCVPLDADSLAFSWAQMISAHRFERDLLEVMAVADDRCVAVDAVCLERALALPADPNAATARDLLAAEETDTPYLLLPPRFGASMRLRMSAERLEAGDLDDYATSEAVRSAVRDAVAGLAGCDGVEPCPPSPLMLTGVAPSSGPRRRARTSRPTSWPCVPATSWPRTAYGAPCGWPLASGMRA